jgi:cell division protease FtsH
LKTPNKQSQSRMLLAVVTVVLVVLILSNLMSTGYDKTTEVKYSEFRSFVENPENENDRIIEATFQENHLVGVRSDKSKVSTYVPNDEATRKYLESKGVVLNYVEPEKEGMMKAIIVNLLPMLLILGVLFFLMRSLQAGGGKAMSFGKSRAKMSTNSKVKITFKDIAGIDEAKQELQEIIEFLKKPGKFTKLGGRIPKGVILIGPPGTGKTILAKGVAGEAGVPFFSISGSDFVEMFVGVGASRVRDLFDQAKKNSPCIVFIDEIDAVGRHRGAGLGGGHDEREQTLNQLLVEMDGFEANAGVIVIAATNRSDVLDPALLRPGRFDRRVEVPPPDVKGRKSILEVHSRKSPLSDDVDLSVIAQGTPGFTGADLENLINESALIAARRDATEICMRDVEAAKDKILMGHERKSMILSDDDKRKTAYHEAGHALIGLLTKSCDPVHKVSIIPRGRALGVTIMLPQEDRVTLSKTYAEGFILYAMGGRAAEELVYNMRTSGASDDIQRATEVANKMIRFWGMSEIIGPRVVGKKDEEVFMGRGYASQDSLSQKTAELVDNEIHDLLTSLYNKALTILTENRDKLDALAEALVIKETLDSAEMARLIAGESIVTEEEIASYEKRKEDQKKWRELKTVTQESSLEEESSVNAELETT